MQFIKPLSISFARFKAVRQIVNQIMSYRSERAARQAALRDEAGRGAVHLGRREQTTPPTLLPAQTWHRVYRYRMYSLQIMAKIHLCYSPKVLISYQIRKYVSLRVYYNGYLKTITQISRPLPAH